MIRSILFALFIVLAGIVLFGRHGEFAPDLMMPDARTSAAVGPLRVSVEGGVVRKQIYGEKSLTVWATQPEFTVDVEGASPEQAVYVYNALALSDYESMGAGVQGGASGYIAIDTSGSFTFKPKASERYAFFVMGDPRNHFDRYEAVLARDPGDVKFALCLGDLVNRGDPWEYAKFFALTEKSKLPVYFTVGNHDLERGGRRWYRSLFGKATYAFDFGKDRFAVLDTAAYQPQLGRYRPGWLADALDAPEARHRLAFFHTPPYDPRPGEDHDMQNALFAWSLHQTLLETKTTVAFASHIHDYVTMVRDGLDYVITGGLGAEEGALFAPHVLRVAVSQDGVVWERVDVER